MGKNILKKLVRNRSAMIGLIFIVVLLLMGIFADKLTTHNPELADITNKFLPASREYPLGTDQMGRCMLCRLIYGIRVSMFSAIKVTFIIVLIGVFLGLMAGYCGGVIDNLIMRLADIASTFPSTLLALAIVGIFEPGLENLVLVFICLWWAPFARMVRSSVIKLKETEFVLAAEASGCSRLAIVIKHILPNTLSSIIVYATLRIAAVITHIASFSFIGLGSQPPTPDWGVMLNDGRQYIDTHPEMLLWPGLAIVIVVFAFNLFCEGLNDALTPTEGETAVVKEAGDKNA